jgi:hypothetical protein
VHGKPCLPPAPIARQRRARFQGRAAALDCGSRGSEPAAPERSLIHEQTASLTAPATPLLSILSQGFRAGCARRPAPLRQGLPRAELPWPHTDEALSRSLLSMPLPRCRGLSCPGPIPTPGSGGHTDEPLLPGQRRDLPWPARGSRAGLGRAGPGRAGPPFPVATAQLRLAGARTSACASRGAGAARGRSRGAASPLAHPPAFDQHSTSI